MTDAVLEVVNLQTQFPTEEGVVRAVDGVSFQINRGDIMALVGESGSGKSVTGLSILRLVPKPGRIAGGEVRFRGENLLAKPEREMRHFRGNRISMIFQNPMTALDPSFTIGDELLETILLHQRLSPRQAREQCLRALDLVGIPDPASKLASYPHSLSGGMRQRVMIAMALSCNPDLLIADEPTTNLDASVQAQILDLLERLNRDLGTAILMITHDFGVVARLCRRVAVMYAGRIVEQADVDTVLNRPQHPYTMGLIGSVPRVGRQVRGAGGRRQRLFQIDGAPPNLANLPPGCSFAPRCREAQAVCQAAAPPEIALSPGHTVRCVMRTSMGESHAG